MFACLSGVNLSSTDHMHTYTIRTHTHIYICMFNIYHGARTCSSLFLQMSYHRTMPRNYLGARWSSNFLMVPMKSCNHNLNITDVLIPNDVAISFSLSNNACMFVCMRADVSKCNIFQLYIKSTIKFDMRECATNISQPVSPPNVTNVINIPALNKWNKKANSI